MPGCDRGVNSASQTSQTVSAGTARSGQLKDCEAHSPPSAEWIAAFSSAIGAVRRYENPHCPFAVSAARYRSGNVSLTQEPSGCRVQKSPAPHV